MLEWGDFRNVKILIFSLLQNLLIIHKNARDSKPNALITTK